MAARGADAVAARLGVEPVVFPGDHAGFLGGEYGMHGEPDGFARRLREVLDADQGSWLRARRRAAPRCRSL